MDKMKELSAGFAEMRSVAQRLLDWADDLERSFRKKEAVQEAAAEAAAEEAAEEAAEAVPETRPDENPAAADEEPVTRAGVKNFLTKLCASGYSAQVKALIASYGAASLSAVPEEALGELLDAALLIGGEEEDGHAG